MTALLGHAAHFDLLHLNFKFFNTSLCSLVLPVIHNQEPHNSMFIPSRLIKVLIIFLNSSGVSVVSVLAVYVFPSAFVCMFFNFAKSISYSLLISCILVVLPHLSGWLAIARILYCFLSSSAVFGVGLNHFIFYAPFLDFRSSYVYNKYCNCSVARCSYLPLLLTCWFE